MTQELASAWIENICSADEWVALCKDPDRGGVLLRSKYPTTPPFNIRAFRLTTTCHSDHYDSSYCLSEDGDLLHVTAHHNTGAVCVSRYSIDTTWSNETIDAILLPLKELDDMIN